MTFLELVVAGLVGFEWAVLGYFFLVNVVYGILLVAAAVELRQVVLHTRGRSMERILSSPLVPTISVLAPAHNEEATVVASVSALLSLHYSNLEVVVVNDGSVDRTLEVLEDAFELVAISAVHRRRLDAQPVRVAYRSRTHPQLVVVDKENGGKADALNAALNFATGELACVIDADTLIEEDALQRLVQPFLSEDRLLAAGGTIRVANGCDVEQGRVTRARAPRAALPGIQVVEYLRAFLFGRLGWNRLGGNLIISGAFGLFRREAVVDAGGYLHDSVGEDMELVVRLRRHGYEHGGPHQVAFIPDPVAWTEVPESWRVLGRQRERWHRGLSDALWRHRRMLFNPRYGAVGLVVYPYFLFIELLSPVIELLGLLGLATGLLIGVLDFRFALLFFLVAYAIGIVLSLFSLLLEELSFRRYTGFGNRVRLLTWAFLENLGFRQVTALWRVRGAVRYLQGRTEWGAMERKGFDSTT
ncbi:MAG TPA: glycosyltransferase [Gemmatimonadota bacterium]|nr:glycosyltransferase [Gemmatimonadota bacterium]